MITMNQRNKNSEPKHEPYYFQYFVISAITFLVGMGTVVYVNLLLPPSTKQELFALGGLILGIPGGCIAMYCYIRLLLTRIKNFFNSP